MGNDTSFKGTERFEILSQIGKGGMGVVYHAYDREQKAHLALKTIRFLDADLLARFKQEFRTLQDLQHPNLVSLGELIEHEGQWFFTMELVEGVDFLSYVTRSAAETREPTTPITAVRPLPRADSTSTSTPDTVAMASRISVTPSDTSPATTPSARLAFHEPSLRSVLAQVAQGLDALHRTGNVHRDIKPSNIKVTPEGRAVILDFGLITKAQEEHDLTRGTAIGTCLYMAPEQGAGSPVDEKADWYSLGVLLYQALTNTKPFHGTGPQILLQKQKAEPVAPRSLVPQIPEDLSTLCVDLLRTDPQLRPSGSEVLRRLRVDVSSLADSSRLSRTLSHSETRFVGRQAELAQLQQAFLAAAHRQAKTVLVRGESGVGKSALVHHFAKGAHLADPNTIVFAGRCYQQESVPFKAFDGVIDQICHWLRRLSRDQTEMYLPRNTALLARVFPVLQRVDSIAEAPQTHATIRDPQELRSRVFRGVRELFYRIAERHPVIVVIDDLQWSDADSLAMLAELMRPPDAPQILLLATVRNESDPQLLEQITSETIGAHETIELGPLSPEESQTLTSALLALALDADDRATHIRDIVRESRGYPLFIDTLIRYLDTNAAPITNLCLDEALWRQIAELDPLERHLLELIALAGFPMRQQVICDAAMLEPIEFAKRLKSLRIARLTRTSGGATQDAVEPYHDRIRETVLEHLDLADSIQNHRALARALETAGNSDPEKLAHHWLGAGHRDKAARYAIQAAKRASEALAFDRAAEFYHLAIGLGSDGGMPLQELFIALGDCLANAGKGAEAASVYNFAIPDSSPSQALDLKRRIAEQLLTSGHFSEGSAAFERVFAMQDMSFPATPARALLRLIGLKLWVQIRGRGYTTRDPREISEAERTRIDTCWAAVKGFGGSDIILGQVFQTRGLLLALDSGDPYRIARALAMEKANLAIERPKAQELQDQLTRESERLATLSGEPHAHAMVLFSKGSVAFIDGRRKDALEEWEKAEVILRTQCVGAAWELSTIAFLSLDAMGWTGAWQELADRAPRELQRAKERGDRYTIAVLQAGAMCFAQLLDDQPEKALLDAEAAIHEWGFRGFQAQHQNYMRYHALADLYRGNIEAAYHCIENHWPALRRSLLLRVPFMRITQLHLRAACAIEMAKRQPPRRRALLRRARQITRRLQREKLAWAKPMALSLASAMALLDGDHEKARDRLGAAMRAFKEENMTGMMAAAQLRMAQLITGSEAERLASSATEWMREQGVKNPQKMAAALLPGFPAFE